MPLPRTCSECTAYDKQGHCIRRAPVPSTTEDEWAKWPLRQDNSRCMEGIMDRKPILCRDCFFWDLPDDVEILVNEQPESAMAIWLNPEEIERRKRAKYCILRAIGPSGHTEMYYPRMTYATDSCGDGETPEEFAERVKKNKG